jgi:hypothetical protein
MRMGLFKVAVVVVLHVVGWAVYSGWFVLSHQEDNGPQDRRVNATLAVHADTPKAVKAQAKRRAGAAPETSDNGTLKDTK